MNTLIILFMLAGVLVCYYSSQKAMIMENNNLIEWISLNRKLARIIGGSFILLSIIIAIINMGTGSGIFGGLVILMSILSVVVLTAPLQFFKWPVLVTLLFISFIVEFFIF